LCTGCCYGNVACATSPVVPLHFPVYANTTPLDHFTTPAGDMIARGYQTAHGFKFNPISRSVEFVEPGSAAANAGLESGDVILRINGKSDPREFAPNANGLQLTVSRGEKEIELPAFRPTSIGLNPTQPFETITMCLLLFFLLSYYPYKRRDGELMVLLMLF